jgi:hypothetical protein
MPLMVKHSKTATLQLTKLVPVRKDLIVILEMVAAENADHSTKDINL